jgi:hypothetical protein
MVLSFVTIKSGRFQLDRLIIARRERGAYRTLGLYLLAIAGGQSREHRPQPRENRDQHRRLRQSNQ